MHEFDPLILALWGVVVGVAFVITCIRVCSAARYLRAYRKDLIVRTNSLRIHKMLPRLKISLGRFMRKARPIDVERHLLVCEKCATPETCDAYLSTESDRTAPTFCPNFGALQGYSRRATWTPAEADCRDQK